MIYTKNCIICGTEFHCNNDHYILCKNPECRRKRSRIYNQRYWDKNGELMKEKARKRYHDNYKPVLCKICGRSVSAHENNKGRLCRPFYHEDCVIDEALVALAEGKKGEDKRIRRACNLYGYTIKELREIRYGVY